MLANIPAPWSIWDGMKDTKRIKNHSKHWIKKYKIPKNVGLSETGGSLNPMIHTFF
jgi:phage gp37-like protein